jgi:cell wall-associated NlpC family hydrolase
MNTTGAMNSWVADYIGREWVSGAQGPQAFDCWGFVRFIQRAHFNRQLPMVNFNAHSIKDCMTTCIAESTQSYWQAVDAPLHGDCILMSQGKQPSHVGLWVTLPEGDAILHCVKGAGVVLSSLVHLKMMGYYILGAYQWQA